MSFYHFYHPVTQLSHVFEHYLDTLSTQLQPNSDNARSLPDSSLHPPIIRTRLPFTSTRKLALRQRRCFHADVSFLPHSTFLLCLSLSRGSALSFGTFLLMCDIDPLQSLVLLTDTTTARVLRSQWSFHDCALISQCAMC